MNKFYCLFVIFVIGILLYILFFRSIREGLSHQSEMYEISILYNTKGFSPKTIDINVGDTVMWTNEDRINHTVTHRNGKFDSGSMSQGEAFFFTFLQTGIYNYYCSIHPKIKGIINVT